MDINSILPIALTFVVTGIAVAYGLQVLGDVQDDTMESVANCGLNSTGGTGGTISYTNCGNDYNATVDSIDAVSKFPEKLGLLATIVIASIVLFILVRYLAGRT